MDKASFLSKFNTSSNTSTVLSLILYGSDDLLVPALKEPQAP